MAENRTPLSCPASSPETLPPLTPHPTSLRLLPAEPNLEELMRSLPDRGTAGGWSPEQGAEAGRGLKSLSEDWMPF